MQWLLIAVLPLSSLVRSSSMTGSEIDQQAMSVCSEFTVVERPVGRSPYQRFFDQAWKKRRAFSHGVTAYSCCRHLLGQRNEADLPFLNFVLGRAIAEHPDYLELLMFQLVAHDQQKKLRKVDGVMFDLEYHLYAVMRRAKQESASAGLGTSSMSAVNLMEFDSKMNVRP
ncbi:hypothetical protein T484DRAFT_1816828 [Baffinella frigidus]|nr:hypothetical protein T484DRAFT_1816828 [Cryptophyta sp. CCMP2293]